MTLPSDPLQALNWAWNHSERAWWIIGALGAGLAWTNKRMREWKRRNALELNRAKLGGTPWTAAATAPPAQAAPQAAKASSYTAAAAYAASAYAAQPAYAAPAAAPPPPAPARKLHREQQRPAVPAQRAVTPVARSVDVPAASGAWTLATAFGDPAHARTAVVIAEVLGPPLGLR